MDHFSSSFMKISYFAWRENRMHYVGRKSDVIEPRGVEGGGCRVFFVSIMRDELQLSHVWASSWENSFLVGSAGCTQSPWFYVECQSLYYTISPPLFLAFDKSRHTDSWNEKCIEQGIFMACWGWMRKLSTHVHTKDTRDISSGTSG